MADQIFCGGIFGVHGVGTAQLWFLEKVLVVVLSGVSSFVGCCLLLRGGDARFGSLVVVGTAEPPAFRIFQNGFNPWFGGSFAVFKN